VAKENPTTTSGDEGTKPAVDISKVKPDESGNVNITKSAAELRNERREASSPAPEAKKEEPKVDEKTKEGGSEEAPPPETISKVEHQKIIDSLKGGHKGTADKMRSEIAALKQAQIDLQTQTDEAGIATWLRRVEEDGGDVKVAQSIAERDRASKKLQRELAEQQAEVTSKLAVLNEAGFKKTAYDLVATYKLGEDALEELLKAESPVEMENKALKLAREKEGAESRPTEKLDKAVASTKGVDLSKYSLERQAGMAMEGEL